MKFSGNRRLLVLGEEEMVDDVSKIEFGREAPILNLAGDRKEKVQRRFCFSA